MLENRLFIDKQSNRDKIYKNAEKKWIIEYRDSLKDWDSYYDKLQQEMDFCEYHKQFGKSPQTLVDIIGDTIVFEKMKKQGKKTLVIILNYTDDFQKIPFKDRERIYCGFLYFFLVEWYRDLRDMFQEECPYILETNVEIYFLIDDALLPKKEFSFQNEWIIAKKEDIKYLKDRRAEEFLEIGYVENADKRKDECFVDNILMNLNSELRKKSQILIFNFDKLIFNDYVWLRLVEDILIEKFLQGKNVEIYAIFNNHMDLYYEDTREIVEEEKEKQKKYETMLQIEKYLEIGMVDKIEKLLQNNKNIDITEVKEKQNLLHRILYYDSSGRIPVSSVRYLIQKGVNPISKDYAKMTPLNYAMRLENIEVAKLLLQAGADPNDTDNIAIDAPFQKALSLLPAQESLVKLFLLCGADSNIYFYPHENLLEKIETFMQPIKKVKINFMRKYHKELQEKGFEYFQKIWDIYLQDSEESALHIAARRFKVEEVEELLRQGADIYAEDSLHYTPLMKALARCRLENLQEMLEIAYLLPEKVTERQQTFVKRLGIWIGNYKNSFNKPSKEFVDLDRAYFNLCKRFEISVRKKRIQLPKFTKEEQFLERKHQELFEILVPEKGVAESLQGEVIRITGKIAQEVLENSGKNWNIEYMYFLRAILNYLEKGHSLTQEQLETAKGYSNKLRAKGKGSKYALGLKHLAVLWVLQNETLIPLGKTPYN